MATDGRTEALSLPRVDRIETLSIEVAGSGRRPFTSYGTWFALCLLAVASLLATRFLVGPVRAVAILGETLLELWLLLGVFMRWSGAAPVGRLVMKGALLLVFALSGVTALDRSQAGSLDAINADAPLDPTHPFAGTRSEALLKARYREPDASVLLARVSGVSSQGLTPVRVSAPMTPSIPAALMSKAVKLYELRCAACHGAKGDGKGPGAFAVKPKPRDYTDPAWQATVTDDELGKAIVRGGAGVGKSYMMPASPDLKAKPEMVAALVALVRSFAGGGTLTAEAKR